MGTIYLYHCLKEFESLIIHGTKNHWLKKADEYKTILLSLKSFYAEHNDLTFQQRKLLMNLICRLDGYKYYFLNPKEEKTTCLPVGTPVELLLLPPNKHNKIRKIPDTN